MQEEKKTYAPSGKITIEIKSEVQLEDGRIVKNQPKSYNYVTMREPDVKVIFENDEDLLSPLISSVLSNAKSWIDREEMRKEDPIFFDEDIWHQALCEIKASREMQPAIKEALEKLIKRHLEKLEIHTPKIIFGTSNTKIKLDETSNGFLRRIKEFEGDKNET